MDEKMKEAVKGIIDKLTDEQKKAANECKNFDEMLKLFGEWGIELPDDLSAIVTGGYQFIPYYRS